MSNLCERISVIISAYQIEKYIENCVESIRKQSYQNLEIIIVNDGSTDKTGEILEKYERKDKRIKVINKKNEGLSEARNTALDNATGEYITFVDGDDCIHNRMLEILHSKMIEYSADISFCHLDICKEASIFCKISRIEADDCIVMNSQQALKKFYGNHNINIVTACNKLFRRSLLEDIRFPKGRIHEDVATIYKIIDRADKVLEIKRNLYFYIQRDDSIMNSGFTKNKEALFDSFDEMIEYFEKNEEIIPLVKRQYKNTLNYFYRKSIYQWNGSKEDQRQYQRMSKERYRHLTGKSMPVIINYMIVPLHKMKAVWCYVKSRLKRE